MKTLIITLKIFLFFTILTGIIYPLFITAIAKMLFPAKADGSIIYRDNLAVGSKLIGQLSDTAIYFAPRPSATGYNPLPSGGSNFGLTNAKLKKIFLENKKHFIAFNRLDTLTDVPAEMLFASASGLDPEISVKAARLQIDRISIARHFTDAQKQKLIELVVRDTESPQFNLLGEERVNVLLLNLDLDKIK